MSNESVQYFHCAPWQATADRLSAKYLGPRKTETLEKTGSLHIRADFGLKAALARVISRNGGFNTGANRGFWRFSRGCRIQV